MGVGTHRLVMAIAARIIADSIHRLGPTPRRITTFELRFPRFILAELATHRKFSKNTASSRAIPVAKLIAEAENDPALFVYWGGNRSGMQADEELSPQEIEAAKAEWLAARDSAVAHVKRLLALGLHKQSTNRLLEPFLHTTVLLTATDFANFYALRRHPAAQPEMQALANAMWNAQQASTPVDRTHLAGVDKWHLPLVTDEERREFPATAVKICVGRCARVSFLGHDGKRNPAADIELHDRLMSSGHWSPFEHAALPFRQPWWKRLMGHGDEQGNLSGWLQYRKTLADEHPYQPGQVEP